MNFIKNWKVFLFIGCLNVLVFSASDEVVTINDVSFNPHNYPGKVFIKTSTGTFFYLPIDETSYYKAFTAPSLTIFMRQKHVLNYN